MKLPKDQYKKLLEHLKDRWKPPTDCSLCNGNEWIVPEEVYEMREFHGGGLVIGGSSRINPISPITCRICGNMVFINPLVAGIDLKEKIAEETAEAVSRQRKWDTLGPRVKRELKGFPTRPRYIEF